MTIEKKTNYFLANIIFLYLRRSAIKRISSSNFGLSLSQAKKSFLKYTKTSVGSRDFTDAEVKSSNNKDISPKKIATI